MVGSVGLHKMFNRMHVKSSVLKNLDAFLEGTAILVGHVDMCRDKQEKGMCGLNGRILIVFAFSSQHLGGEFYDPDFRRQGRYSRGRCGPIS